MRTKSWFLLIVVLVLSIGLSADEYVEIGNKAYWIYDNGTAEWVPKGTYHWSGEVTVPSSIEVDGKAYSVTVIGEYGFNNSPLLTGVTIPNTVVTISKNAFTNCPALTDIHVSWTGTQLAALKIDANAFDNERLGEITLTVPATDYTTYTTTAPWKNFSIKVEQVAYTITYDLDGGTLEAGKKNPTVYKTDTTTFVLNNPVRDGYSFRGWNTANNLLEVIPSGSTGDRSYKALWAQLPAKTPALYSLLGIPDDWKVKDGETEILITDGKTADIVPGTALTIIAPADAHVQSISFSPICNNLADIKNPDTIVCGNVDTITGTIKGNIMIVIPNNTTVVFRDVNLTNTAKNPAVFCEGNATIISEGKTGNYISCTTDQQPAIQAFGRGATITLKGSAQMTVKGGGNVENIDLNGATAVNSMTAVLSGNVPIIYPPVPKEYTYDGTVHELISAGYTNAGKLLYSLDEKTWLETIPTADKVKTYTVYYKAGPVGFYNETIQQVTAKIVNKAATISFAETAVYQYAGTVFTNPLTNTGDGVVTYTSKDPSVASVDANGQVTCLCAGCSTTISARVTNTASSTYAIDSIGYTVGIYKQLTTSWVFDYTGAEQSFTAPATGTYRLEVYGAAGGKVVGNDGGNGGYAQCEIKLTCGQTLYIYVGGKGQDRTASDAAGGIGGWNGGGNGGNAYNSDSIGGAGGGGATHISTVSGDMIGSGTGYKTILDTVNYIIIAGGGGGASIKGSVAAAGGGAEGGRGTMYDGTQYGSNWYHSTKCSYGKAGGAGANYNHARAGSGGGGAGYKGGNAHADHTAKDQASGGCGGSSAYNAKKGTDYSTISGKHTGNGKAVITYLDK